MNFLFTSLALVFQTRRTVMLSILGFSTALLLLMVFFKGKASNEERLFEQMATHHFETLENVNEAINNLGHPTGDELRCLLQQRREIRDANNLSCP